MGRMDASTSASSAEYRLSEEASEDSVDVEAGLKRLLGDSSLVEAVALTTAAFGGLAVVATVKCL